MESWIKWVASYFWLSMQTSYLWVTFWSKEGVYFKFLRTLQSLPYNHDSWLNAIPNSWQKFWRFYLLLLFQLQCKRYTAFAEAFAFASLCCKQVIDTSTFQSYQTQQLYNIFHKLNCKSKFILYLMECALCKIQYVGKAATAFLT